MAFKMKGFPYAGKSAFKQNVDPTEPPQVEEEVKETEEIPTPPPPPTTPPPSMGTLSENAWDTDGDGQMNDEERLAFLKNLGLSEKEMQAEMNALAEEYGSDDYTQDDYIEAAKALAKRKKEGSAIQRYPKSPMEIYEKSPYVEDSKKMK